ncbi:MAG: hypothetical protein KIT87_02780, partial [Anaerolineae bacterium]|nr:hypothetical protein [Anaerolineae bacterium]
MRVSKSWLRSVVVVLCLLMGAQAGQSRVAAAGACPYLGYWQLDANGALGTLRVTPNESSGACVGALKLDLALRWEAVTWANAGPPTFQFVRPSASQTYSGVIYGDRVLGTFSDNGQTYSWEARRTQGLEGLVELGDYDHDGQVDNQDIVAYLRSFKFKLNTYRVCDDVYNPACYREANSALWRPDGLLKTVAADQRDRYAIPDLAYPPEKLRNIREVGKALLTFPQDDLRAIFNNQDPWTLDFSGVVNQDGVTGRWSITANGYRGWLILMSRQNGYGRLELGDGAWTPVYRATKVSATQITFRRRLANGAEQLFSGTISGSRHDGSLGDRLSGTYTYNGRTYAWSASGTVRDEQRGTSQLDLVVNGAQGHLSLTLGDDWVGRLKLATAKNTDIAIDDTSVAWEGLDRISYDPATRQVRFRRPGSAQTYTGTVADYSSPLGISGQFTSGGQRYDWSATPQLAQGGTYQDGCRERADWEVGNVCHIIYLSTETSRWNVAHEILGHGSFANVSLGRTPYSDATRSAYNQVGFRRDSRALPTRPGFVSSYAAQNGDWSHDYVETVSAYVGGRTQLWSLAYADLNGGSDLLKQKMEFVRARVFEDTNIDRTWQINANGFTGTLTLTFGTSYSDLLWGQLKLDNGPQEGLSAVHFNGTTLTFRR